ncbi:VOC family protein [Mesorhizobium sp. M7A.F.Ca.US.006.01.1.1]|uniref:VOC family protein n=1 Tax=Mesorhizobium sp. M7A.F.Ca.US.006.01.1.1 TaxID=2496707 RepID=UPI0013E3DE3A|nr:VOC family protein [Mesorhizobium sp. M7A.F.Ca.US.006.01.1.1]
MFDHISIKVGNSAAVNAFYKGALAPLGITQKFLAERPDGLTGGYGRERVEFFVGQATSAVEAPFHLAFEARSRSEVDAFYAAAIAAGGRDNGSPGLRPKYHENYYAAFVIDPASNNVEGVYQGAD